MEEINKKMERLQKAKKVAEESAQEKSRLDGEMGALNTQQANLEKTCEEKFSCKMDALPELIKALDKESEEALVEAEKTLGIIKEEEQ